CSVSCGEGIQSRTVTCRTGLGSQTQAVACLTQPKPPDAQSCIEDNCIHEVGWHIGDWGLCSESCDSGIRTRQVTCADRDFKSYNQEMCKAIQPWVPETFESCNIQPCHQPQQVPSMQDTTGYDINRLPLLTRYIPDHDTTEGKVAVNKVVRRRMKPGKPQSQNVSLFSVSLSELAQNDLVKDSPPSLCDELDWTAARVLMDAAQMATLQLLAPLGKAAHLTFANIAAYPINCLLPSAHGPCTDWTTRWYFVYDVGKCNRFWYGGCHGNKNNFASEEECMGTCHESVRRSDVRHQHHIAIPSIQSSPHLQEGNAQEQQQQQSARGAISHSHTGGHRTFHVAQGGSEAQSALSHVERGWGRTMITDALPESQQGTAVLDSQQQGSYHSTTYAERRMDPAKHLPGLGETVVSGHTDGQLTVNGQTVYHEREEWRRPSGADESTMNGFEHQTPPDSSLQHSLNRVFLEGSRSSTVEAGLGQSIRLLCKAANSPFSRVEWQKDGRPVPSDRLKIYKNEPSVVDANIGERVRLPCRVEAAPSLTIEWQKNGQPISSSRYRQQADGALVISRLSTEDAGFFTCIASNGRAQDQRRIQIRPQGELRITGVLPSLSVSEGENTQLRCSVTGNNVNIRWSRNGVPVRADGHHVHMFHDGSLHINNVQIGDEGSYTCSAYRGSNSVSASTEVKVIRKRSEVPAPLPVDPSRECVDQPHLANCELILQAQLCNNEYYSSFCCASCSRYQPKDLPHQHH
ncbi:UNVERIFIED_CONTAM: hypothetical protein K2H54_050460, partial [Gekko kuhli]